MARSHRAAKKASLHSSLALPRTKDPGFWLEQAGSEPRPRGVKFGPKPKLAPHQQCEVGSKLAPCSSWLPCRAFDDCPCFGTSILIVCDRTIEVGTQRRRRRMAPLLRNLRIIA